jgi:hypothetical protein
MTICMAALCVADDGSPLAVVAADRMVTLGGFIEFEHAKRKMVHPSPYAIALIAGDSLEGTRLAAVVADQFEGTSPRTHDIAQALAAQYAATRQQRMEQALLTPRALNLAAFYQAHNSLNPQVTMMLDQQMLQYNLGVELILAGVDLDGAHLFAIHNPGGLYAQNDVIGYVAIGSGAIHALQSMIGFGHHADVGLKETVFRTYVSKRRSEVAPGVGNETDLGIVSRDGVAWLSDEQLATLAGIYQEYQATAAATLSDKLSALQIEPARQGGLGGPGNG